MLVAAPTAATTVESAFVADCANVTDASVGTPKAFPAIFAASNNRAFSARTSGLPASYIAAGAITPHTPSSDPKLSSSPAS